MLPMANRIPRPRRHRATPSPLVVDPSNPYDETSPVPGEELYTTENPHPLLGMMDPPAWWYDRTPVPNLKDANGNEIMDRAGKPIRNFHGWPRYISSTVRGDVIERLFRTNCQVTYDDIWARQPNWVPRLNRRVVNILNNHRARQGRLPCHARCWSTMYEYRTPPKTLLLLAEEYTEEQIAKNTTFTVTEEGIQFSHRSKLLRHGYYLKDDVPHQISPVLQRAREVAKLYQKIAEDNGKKHWTHMPDAMLPTDFTFTSAGFLVENGEQPRANEITQSRKRKRADSSDSGGLGASGIDTESTSEADAKELSDAADQDGEFEVDDNDNYQQYFRRENPPVPTGSSENVHSEIAHDEQEVLGNYEGELVAAADSTAAIDNQTEGQARADRQRYFLELQSVDQNTTTLATIENLYGWVNPFESAENQLPKLSGRNQDSITAARHDWEGEETPESSEQEVPVWNEENLGSAENGQVVSMTETEEQDEAAQILTELGATIEGLRCWEDALNPAENQSPELDNGDQESTTTAPYDGGIDWDAFVTPESYEKEPLVQDEETLGSPENGQAFTTETEEQNGAAEILMELSNSEQQSTLPDPFEGPYSYLNEPPGNGAGEQQTTIPAPFEIPYHGFEELLGDGAYETFSTDMYGSGLEWSP